MYNRHSPNFQLMSNFTNSIQKNGVNNSLMLMKQFVLTINMKINRWRDQMLMSWNSTLIVSWIRTNDWLQLKLILCDDSCSYSVCFWTRWMLCEAESSCFLHLRVTESPSFTLCSVSTCRSDNNNNNNNSLIHQFKVGLSID